MVTTHFSIKAFGKIILLLTTFASIFNGYTVVGIPDETEMNGFSATDGY